MLNYILKFKIKVSSGFSLYQNTLQTGSIIKLNIVINIDIAPYGKNYRDNIFGHIAQG